MSEQGIHLERVVQARPDRVWEVLTDVAHADQTLRGVERVNLLTDGPYRAGTRWRETRRMFGKQATEELRVTVAEAPKRTVVEADSPGVHYVTEFTLTPASTDATRLAMSFTAAPGQANLLHKALWRLLGRLGLEATKKVMRQDLADIAARAERV